MPSGVQTCARSEEHTSELQSHSHLVCRLLLEKKKELDVSGTMASALMMCLRSWRGPGARVLCLVPDTDALAPKLVMYVTACNRVFFLIHPATPGFTPLPPTQPLPF